MSVLDVNKSYCRYFEEISQIPHGSFNEEHVAAYLVNFAKKHQLEYIEDDMHDVIIYKKASAGCETQPTLILQAHSDMVCEKEADCDFDFEKDPLKLYVEDGWLKAQGTTLGADDGMGVALILAILDDESITHPALEAVFTVQEEIGLCGAFNLKKEYFKGTRLINLDGGGENVTCVSSSGGLRAEVSIDTNRCKTQLPAYEVEVGGLDGGHSGVCIHQNKGNANKLLARVLHEIADLQLASIEGGAKENAIARSSKCTFVSDLPYEVIEHTVKRVESELKVEYAESDANVYVKLNKVATVENVMDVASSLNVIHFIYLCDNGVLAMSQTIKDLPTLSLNLGVVYTEEKRVVCCFAIRSPMDSAKDDVVAKLRALACLCHGHLKDGARYPGWNYEPVSKLRDLYREVCKEQGYDDLHEFAVHGGLETGVFKALIPELDIISTGAIAEGEHTPQERLNLASFDRTYQLIKALVERCAK